MLSPAMWMLDTQEKQQFMEHLLEEYGALLYARAKQYARSQDAVEDIVQDCFVKIMTHIDTIMGLPPCSLASYLAMMMKNTALDHDKVESRRERRMSELSDPEDAPDDRLPVEQYLIDRESGRRFYEVWSRLGDTSRTLLTKKYVLEESNAEIAAWYGCKESSVRMLLSRARREAAELYKEWTDNDKN